MDKKALKQPLSGEDRPLRVSRLKRYLPWIAAAGMTVGGLALARLGTDLGKPDIVLKVPTGEITAFKRDISCALKESRFDLFVTRPGSKLLPLIEEKIYGQNSELVLGISGGLEDRERFYVFVRHPSDSVAHPKDACANIGEAMENLLSKPESSAFRQELAGAFGKAMRELPDYKRFYQLLAQKGEIDKAERYFQALGELCYVQAVSWLRVKDSHKERFHSVLIHELFHGQSSVVRYKAGIGRDPAEEALARYTELGYSDSTKVGLANILEFYLPEYVWNVSEEAVKAGVSPGFRTFLEISREEIITWAGLMDAFKRKAGARSLVELLDTDSSVLREAAREVLDAEFRRLLGEGYREMIDTEMFGRVLADPCIRSL